MCVGVDIYATDDPRSDAQVVASSWVAQHYHTVLQCRNLQQQGRKLSSGNNISSSSPPATALWAPAQAAAPAAAPTTAIRAINSRNGKRRSRNATRSTYITEEEPLCVSPEFVIVNRKYSQVTLVRHSQHSRWVFNGRAKKQQFDKLETD